MKRKLRVLAVALATAVSDLGGTVWAQFVAALEEAGWTKVESFSGVDVSQYYYVFCGCRVF